MKNYDIVRKYKPVWFCGRTNVGIVQVPPLVTGDEVKYYIAAVAGHSESADIEFIADYGSLFPKEAGDILFADL
jgi:hypothetical protein